jgi:hypothetical protein
MILQSLSSAITLFNAICSQFGMLTLLLFGAIVLAGVLVGMLATCWLLIKAMHMGREVRLGSFFYWKK